MSKLSELQARYGGASEPTFAPRVPGFSPALRTPAQDLTRLSPLQRLEAKYRLPEEEEEEQPQNRFAHFVNELPEPVRRAAGGAIRGLASALEPLQLPQDLLFAALAGAIDKETTIAGRLSQVNLADYMPGGVAPPRISSGEEIFNLMGLEGSAAKWAGIAADLTVDPLVFGSWLRLGGKLSGVQDLIRLGDKVDDFISPIGMGREVVKVARRSPTMSRMMDDRMLALERVFRDPNSTMFGIRRFGKKSTDFLERFVLPKEMVDRLRYGREFASDSALGRRAAESVGATVPTEAAGMMKRAVDGISETEDAKDTLRTFMRTAEEQRVAYEARLSALSSVERDVIEQAVYETIRPDKKKGPGVGLLAFLDGPEGAARLSDPAIRTLADDAYSALAKAIEGRAPTGPGGRFQWSDFVDEATAKSARDRLAEQQGRVGEVARERARMAGLVGEDAVQAEARAVRAYNNYLGDTLVIDAKLGMATSGLPYVTKQIRARVVELTGDSALSERILNTIMDVGLRGGQTGLDKLKDVSIGQIRLSSIVTKDVRRRSARLDRIQAYNNALKAERIRIAGANMAERRANLEAFVGEAADLADRSNDFAQAAWRMAQRFASAPVPPTRARRGMPAQARTAMKNSEGAVRESRKLVDAVERYRKVAADFAENGGLGLADMNRLVNAERGMIKAIENLGKAVDGPMPNVWGIDNIERGIMGAGVAALRQAPDLTARPEGIKRFATSLLSDMQEAHARRLQVREAVRPAPAATDPASRLMAKEARKAEEARIKTLANEAAEAAVPRSELLARPTGTLVVGDEIIPFQGKNAIGEDILAYRINSGQYKSIDEALEAPLTFRELIDGIDELQALPIGEFFEGLMNGHLRRSYAIFGDADDFQRHIDNIRVGTIIPSSIFDEAALFKNMPGFEVEAQLIMDYHGMLQRGKRGVMLKKSSIYEYLVNSNVSPARANEALKRMAQSLGPENGNLRHFLNMMEEFVPNYRAKMRDRADSLAKIGDDPRAVSGQRYFDPTKEVPEKLLEGMGEFAMARASIVESTEIARRTVGRQEAVQNLYQTARDHGLIRSNKYTDQFGVTYQKFADNAETLGGFAGKYMHPYLVDELRKMTAVKGPRVPEALTRVRAMITGGYLAAPSVIAANFFGGLYQAGTVGINPATMLKRLFQVADDMQRSSLGYRSDLIHEIKRNLNLEISSLSYQDLMKDMNRVRLDDFGLGKEGLGRVFDDVSQVYERFLQRPGIGKYRTRFAGLDGFQFTENWMKVAGYVEMKERLIQRIRQGTRAQPGIGAGPLDAVTTARIEKEAAEFARIIVFDYSELPTALNALKEYGLVLFPGFTYFLAGRTIDAWLRRPGALAVADRMSEAVSNATLSAEEQIVAHLGTPDWLKDDQGVPMPFTMRRGPENERIVNMIPLNQLVPTSTIWDFGLGAGNPWSESIASGGLWGPFAEVIMALVSGEGDAPITGRYGNRVFDADSEGARKASDVMRFLFNTLAPSNVKKLITENMEGELAGLLPEAVGLFSNIGHFGTDGMSEAAYSFDESRTLRPDRGIREAVISSVLRSPQPVALEGPLVGLQRELRNEQARLGEQLTMLRRRANRARSEGDEANYERWVEDIRRRQDEFNSKWGEYLEFYNNYRRRRIEEERR